ncbi:hypothetical protein [Roseovarius sp.]|uniref:hypothetical protein n=1 Tax=Roseovarius sp. TaxID=1486281 RepID=UPI0035695239
MSEPLPFYKIKLQYLLEMVTDHALDDNALRVALYLALAHADHETCERLQAQLDGIAGCATLLIRSQIASMQALRGLLSEEASYNALDAKLNESLMLARDAEERLRQS